MRIFYKYVFVLNALIHLLITIFYLSYLSISTEGVTSVLSLSFLVLFTTVTGKHILDVLIYLGLSVIFLGLGLIFIFDKFGKKRLFNINEISLKKQLRLSLGIAIVIIVSLGLIVLV